MLQDIKTMLGEQANNFTDAQITLAINQTVAEVSAYTRREIDLELSVIVERIVVIKLNRINTEGFNSQGFAGVSESYLDGLPADIMLVLNRKRKIVVL